jgi:hypothetical protein
MRHWDIDFVLACLLGAEHTAAVLNRFTALLALHPPLRRKSAEVIAQLELYAR